MNKEYKKSIRKFSEKNKSIKTSLLEQGLKIDRDYFMFLPNLSDKKGEGKRGNRKSKSKDKSHSKKDKL